MTPLPIAQDEELRTRQAAHEKREEEQRAAAVERAHKNPNPGPAPRLVVPGGR